MVSRDLSEHRYPSYLHSNITAVPVLLILFISVRHRAIKTVSNGSRLAVVSKRCFETTTLVFFNHVPSLFFGSAKIAEAVHCLKDE